MAESCESEDDKRELGSYVSENEGVITSMEERILLLKAEVENRGQLWVEAENMADADAGEDQGASATINGAGSDGNALGELGTGTRSVPAPSANADLRNINEQAEENGVYL